VTVTSEQAAPKQAVLERADGVELIGEMKGSGYKVPPSLVRRADGQTIQLTPLLYATLREIDGARSADEVAAAVSESTGRTVNESNIRHLVDDQLRPLGLLVQEDGSQPKTKKRSPLLGLRFRYAVTEPERTKRLTDPFRFLFRPWMAVPLLAAFAVVCWWVFFSKGLASAAYDAFERPGLLILVFVVTILSAGFHEFGHAAAARYGGATPGVMGFGVYLVWPAFYTDVTDTYRLGRRGRVRTDLGGLYFNAIVAVVIVGLWWWLHYDALLLVVATQILQMLRQLAPMVRFDGYHVLADITGVPDLYSRIKPTLLGLLPWRWGDPHARMLKPWARILVTMWVMVVVPMLLCALAGAIVALPRLLGSAWSALGKQQEVLSAAWTDGDMIQAIARVLAIIAILIPVAGVLYMLSRIGRQSIIGAWQTTAGKPVLRILVTLLGAVVVTGIAFAWWPGDGKYRPIEPGERGTVGDIVYALGFERISQPSHRTATPRPAAASRQLVNGQHGTMRSVWDTRMRPPTFTQPQLAVILVPKAAPGARTNVGGGGAFAPTTTADTADQGWVFPVDRPMVRESKDDNQALNFNTTDNTTQYEAAFAMVWVEDGRDAMNVNEAQAYASCNSCSAVSVAYQVVFVIDTDDTDDNVAAPQNLAGALNYDCVNCMTYALADQLFITLDRPLNAQEMLALAEVWAEAKILEARIDLEDPTLDLNTVDDQLAGYTARIKAIVAPAMAPTVPPSTASQTASQTSPSTVSTAEATPIATPTATPTPSPTSPTPTATEPSTAPSTETSSTPSTETSSSSPSTEPTTSGDNTSVATNPDSTTGSDPTPSSDSTTGGSTSDGSTTAGSTTDGSTSDGTTSGGTTSP
jgi:putative peptide zinc metalloprotease protein